MSWRKKIKNVFGTVLLITIVFSLSACSKGGDAEAKEAYKSQKIRWWSIWENEDNVESLINAYQARHPNVEIEYRKFRYEEYEKALLEALAEDRGPDIFTIHNSWMLKYKSKLIPVPEIIKIPVKTTTGTVKKEEVYLFDVRNSITPAQARRQFLDVVAKEMVMTDEADNKQKVWGIPLAMETLVMFYNKDILNNSGIPEPAQNWEDFVSHVEKITKIDPETQQLLISGTALGLSRNVERYFDILSLLMMQNLTPMVDSNGYAVFNKMPNLGDSSPDILPGLSALQFYTQFTTPSLRGYSWDASFDNSVDAFAKGRVGYLFGYMYHYNQLKMKSPKLNFSVAKVPQVGEGQKINYASYWMQVVSKKSKAVNHAWDFLQFITEEGNISQFLTQNNKLPALRSTKLINKALESEILAPSAEQLLTASSWYRGYDPGLAEKGFSEMIDSFVSGDYKEEREVLSIAVDKVNYSIFNKPEVQ